MPILYYVQNGFIGLFITTLLLFYVLGQGGRRQVQDSLFVALLWVTFSIIALELALDLLSGRLFYGSRTLLTSVTLLFFIANPLPGALYLLYLDQLRKRWTSIPRGIGFIAFTPPVIAGILSIASVFNGMVFSIDSTNLYQRGPWFFSIAILDFICMFFGFIYLFVYRQSFRGKNFSLFLFFPLPVMLAAVLQFSFYGMEVLGVGLAITLLVVYLQMQRTQANKDYLTRLYNRSISEQYLQNLVNQRKSTKAIGGILMDINNFKLINDTYGHDLGDKSLRHFAQLLIDSFGSSWFIGRYGGDEFLLLCDDTSEESLAKDVAHFDQMLARFNARRNLPFPLTASRGSSLYGASQAKDSPSFIKVLDHLMYEDKRAFHARQKQNQNTFLFE